VRQFCSSCIQKETKKMKAQKESRLNLTASPNQMQPNTSTNSCIAGQTGLSKTPQAQDMLGEGHNHRSLNATKLNR
jgi:hypothetical protein